MNINKQKHKTIIIHFFDNLDKKDLIILICIIKFSINIVDLRKIDVNTYYLAYKLKNSNFFVFIKNLKFQVIKKVELKIDLKNIILEKIL